MNDRKHDGRTPCRTMTASAIPLICARMAIAVALAITAACGIPSAHAASVDTDERTSRFIVSNIEIELVAQAEGAVFDAPGSFERTIAVRNVGSGACYVRAAVELSDTLAERFASLDINTADWTEKADDGFYYLKAPLPAGATSAPVLTNVNVSGEPSGGYLDFDVLVVVESVQAKNPDTSTEYPDAASAFAAMS